MAIEFVTRARVIRTDVATIKRWRSTNSPLALVEIKSLLGLPTRYLIVEPLGEGEVIRSRHRTKRRAQEAAQKPIRKMKPSQERRSR